MNLTLKDKIQNLLNFRENNTDKIPSLQRKLSNMYGINSGNTAQDISGSFINAYNGNMENNRITAADIIKKKQEEAQAASEYNNPSLKYKSGKMQYADVSNANLADSHSYSGDTGITESVSPNSYSDTNNTVNSTGFNSKLNSNSLASLDVSTELPKLSTNQISDIISKYFSKSTVIKPSDAQGIYDAQQKSGMSALAILGIGALESGYGTSNIAKKKNNIWGWNATNVNPAGNAKSFSQMSQGALEFANAFMKTYYNKYGAKSILSAGTGANPAGKGYAYNDNGTISKSWASSVGNIMGNFYNSVKGNS